MPPKKKTNITTKINIRSIAISWLLHSIKILLGDEGIREYIIVHYYPNFKNKTKSEKRFHLRSLSISIFSKSSLLKYRNSSRVSLINSFNAV
jgi:hypothetical protein